VVMRAPSSPAPSGAQIDKQCLNDKAAEHAKRASCNAVSRLKRR